MSRMQRQWESQTCMPIQTFPLADGAFTILTATSAIEIRDACRHADISETGQQALENPQRGLGAYFLGETTFLLVTAVYVLSENQLQEAVLYLLLERGQLVAHADGRLAALERSADGLRAGRESAIDLLFKILDDIVDSYFPVIDALNQRVWLLETKILTGPRPNVLETLLALRRQILQLRKTIAAEREALHRTGRRLRPLGRREREHLGDVVDHAALAAEMVDASRDLVTSSLDAYMSTVSNRLNEVIKTLTIIATIMMPLTVITGIYGMNFPMREYTWAHGHLFAYGLMAMTSAAMLVYFRHRHWI